MSSMKRAFAAAMDLISLPVRQDLYNDRLLTESLLSKDKKFATAAASELFLKHACCVIATLATASKSDDVLSILGTYALMHFSLSLLAEKVDPHPDVKIFPSRDAAKQPAPK